MPKIEKFDYPSDEEMRHLADKMQDAISTAVSQKIISDERKLREVLYENGWCKFSDIVEEVFDWLEVKGFLNIEVWALNDIKAELKKKIHGGIEIVKSR